MMKLALLTATDVHGHLKSFQGKEQVVVYAIRLVYDCNEIPNHFLECIHTHSRNTRLQDNGSSVSTLTSSVISTSSVHQTASSSQLSQEYNLDGLGNIDKMVLDYLELPSSLALEKGVHQNEIMQKLKISQEKLMKVMDSLELEGLVYLTIDEFHFKSTVS